VSGPVRVGVLAGSGMVFGAGMDLKAFSAAGERPIDERRGEFGITTCPPEKPNDVTEGAVAFVEKCTPVWTGS